MNYASFYGGQTGAPFVIVKNFNSVAEMVEAFKKGDSYLNVNYNEYVIIDTPNKNDPNNGKVYRRGYDYNNDLGGAIYIGQIVGPSGAAPALTLNNYQDINNYINSLTEEEKKQKFVSIGEMTIDNSSLIPGKDLIGNFNDSISWASYVILDENNNQATVSLGFKIPYLSLDLSAESVSPYTAAMAVKEDDGTHPFYSQYKIFIPKGIKGQSFSNLRIVEASQELVLANYTIKDSDIGKQILVYEEWDYSESETGKSKLYYLGTYNQIKNIQLEKDGTLRFSFTGMEDQIFQNAIKSIKKISFSKNSGDISITYNDDSIEIIENAFVYPIKISFDGGEVEGEGTQKIITKYSDGDSQSSDQAINYIMKTAVTPDYHLLFLYSDPERRRQVIQNKKNYTWNSRDDWEDMGVIKQNGGILIGLNFNVEDYPTQLNSIENCISFLNQRFPKGIIDGENNGKLVTIGELNKNKSFYAFNYTVSSEANKDYLGWYYLGTFGNPSFVIGPDTEETREQAASLETNGIWFVTEEFLE